MVLSPTRVRFLNEERDIKSREDWYAKPEKKLWLYNLHYFDDLNAQGAESRRAWHVNLMHRWIAENPPGSGFGWDPYPLSVRVMNWIKWALCGNELSKEVINSLAMQARHLRKHYDYHLLGNHLLVNAKTFIFTGLFFDGAEADGWVEKGLRILTRQLPEQILEDGAHFERSPMYHNLIVEDLLDLLNLFRVYGCEKKFIWHKELSKMRRWAHAMAHPDGQIALFNDSAFGIALTAHQLDEYAERLGLPPVKDIGGQIFHLKQSGYVRATLDRIVLIANVSSVGPDYLPGHAHADTLSFELSIGDKRLIVDSGTSTYDINDERLRQRGTGAHNTVQIDGEDSSEVWSSFRVARRAKVTNVAVSAERGAIIIEAAHNGYRRLPGCGLHRRIWKLTDRELQITDEIEGRNLHEIKLSFHFHPDVFITQKDEHTFELCVSNQSPIIVEMDRRLEVRIEDTTYHPEFGLSLQNKKLVGICRNALPMQFVSCFTWPEGK